MTRWLFQTFMRARARHVARRLAPWLPAEGVVLDFGCGTGHNAVCLRERSGLEICEMDVADLKVVGPPARQLDWSAGQGTIPLADGAVETSVLLFVLSYADHPERVLRELRRVTSGRVLILQSVCREPRLRRLLWWREILEGGFAWDVARLFRWVRNGREGLCVRQVFDRASLIELVAASGWSLVHQAPESEHAPNRWLSRDLLVFEPCRPSVGKVEDGKSKVAAARP